MLKGKLKILEQGGRRRPSSSRLYGERLEPLRTRRFTKENNKGRLLWAAFSSLNGLVAFVAGALPVDQLADRGTGARDRLLVGFDFRAGRFFTNCADAEADFLLLGIHLDDLEVVLQARLQVQRLSVFVSGFRLVAEALDALGDFDESTECRYAQDFAVHYVADVVRLEEGFPNVGLQLFNAERQAALVGLDGENYSLYEVAFLQHLRRMFHALGPAQVAAMHQAVDAVFDFNKRAEIGQVANATFHCHTDRKFLMQRIPWIGRQLA